MKPVFMSCCGSVDIRRGAAITGLICVVASLALYVLVVLGIFFWDDFTDEIVPHHFNISSITEDSESWTIFVLTALWWRNLALSILAVAYIIVSNVMLTGALKYRPNMMRTWIQATIILLPLFIIMFVLDLVLAVFGYLTLFPLIPGIVGLVMCAFWLYGFLCVISAHEVLQNPEKYNQEERKVIHAVESPSTPI